MSANPVHPGTTGIRVVAGNRARAGILEGIAIAARAVGVAMGPSGRYVMAERDWGPPILRDGVGIVRVITLKDRHRQMGIALARSVAVECSDLVGDGTATAVVLFHEMAEAGMKGVAAGLDANQFVAGLRAAIAAALSHLGSLAETDIGRSRMAQVATIAANGDAAIGAIVAEAIDIAGASGFVTVRVGNGTETRLTASEGYRFESRALSDRLPVALRNGVREFEDVFVLVVDGAIDSFEQITPLLETIIDDDQPLLIVAESFGPTVVAGLYENKRGAIIDTTGVRLTVSGDRRSDILSDLAAFTGGEMVGGAGGRTLQDVGREVLGTAARAVFTESETLLTGGGGDSEAIAARARMLAQTAENLTPGHDQQELLKRQAQLASASVTIEIGGSTEIEARERRDRTDNAARAVKAALAQGYVAGGGVALVAAAAAARAVRNGGLAHDAGVMAVSHALEAPTLRVLANAGHEGPSVLARMAGSYPRGVELASGREADLLAAGVLDATSVVTTALKVAASAAEVLIGTEVAIFRNAEPEQ
jgi:chaperonin GroEL